MKKSLVFYLEFHLFLAWTGYDTMDPQPLEV